MNPLEEIIALVKSNPAVAIAVVIVGTTIGVVTGVIMRIAIAYYLGG